ncbi:efflux RND transporter permease subunit [Sinomicrobium weinanense]|uniref:Efflux RND transporter permease subunit n=1 Tax=Sinomicrobium weinanense TaxID=2842200 RepID=A0A926Q309_9FLAO|nr:efflux RND transporter permease subunit [Sinomicrobium weinanense]MBC9797167.1 efflux RND transporter permease subunit [Sinomicrobium weinanense]MBU3124508.1 efflux RND transporter permease subunit [Sinomicrobium weinanense]
MIKKIIERPVLTLVISILLVLAGAFSIPQLPVERFPEIAPPSVSVAVYYPGANSETLAKAVLLPLEEAINGAENMEYINSTATNSGKGRVTVYFKPGSDPNLAAVEVQNRISEVTSDLPLEVIENGIQVMKRMKGTLMTINVFSDGAYDETFLNAYTRINIRRALKRIEGVARAQILRRRDYAMRIWLNPEKLALYNLTPRDIYNQVNDQSFEAGPGKFGENSEEVFEMVIKHAGRFSEPEQYENIVIKTEKDGLQLKLKDIARIEFGASNYTSQNRLDDKPAVTMDITQQNGANAMEIDQAIRETMEEQAKIFPEGMDYQITYSVRDAIDESMNHVKQTLIEAFILVFLVVFIFLQDFKATFITAVTIPISLVGTFFFLDMIGVTMNALSMFSMVLSIGIVVDNAIVVVEAIFEKMQHHKMTARQAVNSALSEITGAIISITVVIAAVFLPVGFLQGPVGVFYQEFAYTIIVAVLISAVISLTLGPVLFVMLYRKKNKNNKKKRLSAFYAHSKHLKKVDSLKEKGLKKFDVLFDKFTEKYISVIKKAIQFKWVSLAGLGVVILLLVFLARITPSAFIPTEDDNFLIYTVSMPEGASLNRTNQALDQAAKILQKEDAVEGVNTVSGFNIVDNSETPSSGLAYIKLKEKSKRGKIKDIQEVVKHLTEKLEVITDIRSMNMYPRPTVQGFGNFDGVQIMLQDRTDGDLGEFGQLVNEFIIELGRQEEIESAFTSYNPNFPQYKLNIDYEKAKALGVSIKDMMFTLQSNFGRQRVSDLNRFTRQYMVYMQADTEFSESPETINSIFVRSENGGMVPINTFVSLEPAFGPETITRYNLYNAAKINITPASGYSTGDVMAKIEELGEKKLPASLSYEWTSMSLEEKKSGSDVILVFIISIVLVYFILAAQYESFWLPIAVMLSLPTGILGVFVFINLAGIDNNIYVQVGILMLLGLLAKNAILIVEFAAQKCRAGLRILDAVLEASALRLRAIIMTSLAFTVGLVPLMFSSGSSAIGNKSVSIGTAGGMLFGIFLGIVIIPVLAYVFLKLHNRYNMETTEEE